MKKSISIISILIISITQSCDRSDDLSSSDDTSKSAQLRNVDPFSNNSVTTSDEVFEKTGPNDGEHPRKDKQHWRIPQDSIR